MPPASTIHYTRRFYPKLPLCCAPHSFPRTQGIHNIKSPYKLRERERESLAYLFSYLSTTSLASCKKSLAAESAVQGWYHNYEFFFIMLAYAHFFLKVHTHGRRSNLSTWKYQFLYDHLSQTTLSLVSTWMGGCSSVAWVLLLTLKVG